jgi:hypothetical protein
MNNMVRSVATFALLVVAAFGLPRIDAPKQPDETQRPGLAMREAVRDVVVALRGANALDRALWNAVWTKVAVAVGKDNTDDSVVWSDTQKLQTFTTTALRIGWRRIGGNESGKYKNLQESVEAAFAKILTTAVQPVTPKIRSDYIDLCLAIAWAGSGSDQ